MRVLIADDSPVVRERLYSMVSEIREVDVVSQAADAHETLEAILRDRPDVVILDIRMPGGGGIKVLETISGKDNAPVVIMLTAFPYPQYRQKCLEAGAEYFFDKAKEFDHVAEVLRQLSGENASGLSG